MEPAGVEVPVLWRGRRARAFVVTRLADRDLTLGPETVARAARAEAAVGHGAETMPEDYAALARLLLRAEGVASSFIESVTAPIVDIVLAEASDHAGRSPAAWVAAHGMDRRDVAARRAPGDAATRVRARPPRRPRRLRQQH